MQRKRGQWNFSGETGAANAALVNAPGEQSRHLCLAANQGCVSAAAAAADAVTSARLFLINGSHPGAELRLQKIYFVCYPNRVHRRVRYAVGNVATFPSEPCLLAPMLIC